MSKVKTLKLCGLMCIYDVLLRRAVSELGNHYSEATLSVSLMAHLLINTGIGSVYMTNKLSKQCAVAKYGHSLFWDNLYVCRRSPFLMFHSSHATKISLKGWTINRNVIKIAISCLVNLNNFYVTYKLSSLLIIF